jgi:hypothetical protein
VAGGEDSTSREAERKLKAYNHVHLPTPNLIYIALMGTSLSLCSLSLSLSLCERVAIYITKDSNKHHATLVL